MTTADRLKGEVAAAAAGDEPRKSAPANSAERKPVILLADDNADMREYVSGLLAGRFQLLQAGTGKTALAEAER